MANQAKYKYGLQWEPLLSDVEIERYMIQHGGRWDREGVTVGEGLFHHYKSLQTLLWPEDDHHRWSDLILTEILNNTITCILGPKDSGKTRCALAKFGLTDYFCFPNNTLTLISSTDVRGLELRVWGDLKTLFQRAKARADWLPGHLIDSKHAICTQNLQEEEVRDMRKGIVCFPKGTLVDTPTGKRKIEHLKTGDEIINAIGVGKIKASGNRIAPMIVRVTLSDGRHIDCTPEHPFLTNRGWIKAIALKTLDKVFSAHETMRIVQETPRRRLSESEILLDSLSRAAASKNLQALRKEVSAIETKAIHTISQRNFLQHKMRELLGFNQNESVRHFCESSLPALRETNAFGSSQSKVLLCKMSKQVKTSQVPRMPKGFHLHSSNEKTENIFLQHLLQMEMEQPRNRKAKHQGNISRKGVSGAFPRCHNSFSYRFRQEIDAQYPDNLRGRSGISENQTRRGIRWWCPSDTVQEEIGRKANGGTKETWVDSVEILEQTSDGRYSERDSGYTVFNLEVSGHPSYSVNGIIVHNCIPCMSAGGSWVGLGKYVGIKQQRRRLLSDEAQLMKPSFMEAIANLNSGDFKGVFVGNPLGVGDPLDKLAEPKDGWGTEGEIVKTTTWDNRFLNGRTINLVGTDSPNFDYPITEPIRYKYLVNHDSIARVVAFYGKDSLQYYSQCLGVRKTGLDARRVITRRLCDKFHASKEVIWKNDKRIKLYAIDAAYGNIGGDRCVGGWGEFGLDINNKMTLCVHEPVIVPVSVRFEGMPEDQISEFVKNDCVTLNIPAEHVFFDSTGRGSLGTSFARCWSAYVNPVEFGGKPTERPVSNDFYIYDPDLEQRRLKRCDEHYSKFVTELWYTVRYIIESGQMRGLPESVIEEGCMREWKMVKGDKIEIETKSDMKERMGRSPDLFDWVATLCEGARRLGFQIEKLAKVEVEEDFTWKRDLKERANKLRKSYTLTHA